jgi:hypothetical protein
MIVYITKYFNKFEEEIKRELLSRLTDELESGHLGEDQEEWRKYNKQQEIGLAYEQMKDEAAEEMNERIKKQIGKPHRYQDAIAKINKFEKKNRDFKQGIAKFMNYHPELRTKVAFSNKNEDTSCYKPNEDKIILKKDNFGNYATAAHENGHRNDHLSGEADKRVNSLNNDILDRMNRSGYNNENFMWNIREEHDRVTIPEELAASTDAHRDMFKNSKVSNKQLHKENKYLMDALDTYKSSFYKLNPESFELNKFNVTPQFFDFDKYNHMGFTKQAAQTIEEMKRDGGTKKSESLNMVLENQLPSMKYKLSSLLKEKGISKEELNKKGLKFDDLLKRILGDKNFTDELRERAGFLDKLRNLRYTIEKVK